jgi:hypothetical protein
MNDHSDEPQNTPHFDDALRWMMTSIESPPPAPHSPEERSTEIRAAIEAAWPRGAPPTIEELAQNPHPVEFWHLRQSDPDVADWPWSLRDSESADDDERPGDSGSA